MNNKIISNGNREEIPRNLVPSKEVASLFSSMTKFRISTGQIIQPLTFMKKLIETNEYKNVKRKLERINLQDLSIGLTPKEIIDHSESTAKYLSFLLLNMTKYQSGKKISEPLNFILAALLHKVQNIEDIISFVDLGEAKLKKAISIVKNYRRNREELEVLLHKKSSKLAIKLFLENSIKSPEELLLYFADVKDTIQSISKQHIGDKEIHYLKVVAELAEYYELEAFSYEIYSYLFQVTDGEQHDQLQEYMYEKIAKKYGKEFSEQHIALEELIGEQIDTFYTLLKEMGFSEKSVVITGRIKQSFSIAKKINMVGQTELARNLGVNKNKLNDLWTFLRTQNFLDKRKLLIVDRKNLLSTLKNDFLGKYKENIDSVIDELNKYSLQNGISEDQEKNLTEKMHDALAWRLIFKNEDDMYKFYLELSNKMNVNSSTKMFDYKGKEMKKKALRAYAPKDSYLYTFCKKLGIDPKINKNRYESLHISMQEQHIQQIADLDLKKKLIFGELQIRTFKMHNHALTEASHHSYKADEVQGEEESPFIDMFEKRRNEINNKMVVTINGQSKIVPYRGNFAIPLHDLYFKHMCDNNNFNPKLISLNDIPPGRNRVIRNGDRLNITMRSGTVKDFLDSQSNQLKLKQQITFLKQSKLYSEKGEAYIVKGAAIIRRVTSSSKRYKVNQTKLLKILNDNYGDKRNILTIEDCQIATGLGLITEQSLKAHIRASH